MYDPREYSSARSGAWDNAGKGKETKPRGDEGGSNHSPYYRHHTRTTSRHAGPPCTRTRTRTRTHTRTQSQVGTPNISLSSLFSLFLFLSLSLSVKRRQEQRYVHRPTGLKGSVAIGDVVTALGQVSVLFAQLQHIPSMRILCLDNVHTLSATPRARARSLPPSL
jgi:hypothetical protein